MKASRRQSSSQRSTKRLQASYKLTVHGPEYGTGEELVINPEAFPDAKVHDLWEISQPDREHPRLVMQIRSLAPIRGKFQISILKDIAAQFQLDTYHEVVVQKIEPTDATVDFIELSFKDQFMSRADIWRYKVAMIGRCMYAGKMYETLGTRAQAEMLLANEKTVLCGVMASHTKLILRSKSSRIFWLIHMSREMWDFDDDGEMYFEKLVNRLVRGLVAKWQETSVSHSVTVLMFSRSYYDKDQFPNDYDPTAYAFVNECQSQGFGPGVAAAHMAHGHGPSINVDCDGRYYEDFYNVIVQDYTGPDWSQLFKVLKHEFATYAQQHRWRLPQDTQLATYDVRRVDDPVTNAPAFAVQWTELPHGVPARAIDGNMLEAINVTLNIFDKHYMDRDLYRAGQGIVMITAGCSVYKVRQRLAQITKQRMMDTGVGMDMISLTKPPMHPVPLFIWQKKCAKDLPTVTSSPLFCVAEDQSIPLAPLSPTMQTPAPTMDASTYNVPHWINVSFLDFDCTCGAAKKSLLRCACLDAQNEAFHALPASRMFDIIAPEACMVFPVALRKLLAPSLPSPRAPTRGAILSQLTRLHTPPASWSIEKAPAHMHEWWLQPHMSTRDLLAEYDDTVFDLSDMMAPKPVPYGKRPSIVYMDTLQASPGLPPMMTPSFARRITSMHNLQRHNSGATPNRSAATSLSRSFPKTPDFGPRSPLMDGSPTESLQPNVSSFDLGTSMDSSMSMMKHRSMTDFLVSPRSRISSSELPSSSPITSKPVRVSAPTHMNPFQLNECSTRLTSNRRRWSHIFPWSQSEHWISGPNWKSLVNPAVLPLTTDYYPAPNELHTSYTESFYTLMLLENSSSLSTHQLLVEMVCQRLSCDYQLVTLPDDDVKIDAVPTVYRLSMGHRIHVLNYDEQQQTVDVKCYFKRPKTYAASNEPVVYQYSLYNGLTKSFQKEQQAFYELPYPHDNWNTTDNLLSGYVDTMPDSSKCRRIRFVIVPPIGIATTVDEAAYFAKFQKVLDFFQSKVGKVVVNVTLRTSTDALKAASNEPGAPKKSTARDYYRVNCSTSARLGVDCRSEWLMLLLDQVHDVGSTYHVDVRWLACSGSVVEDFISGLRRKCKQAGVELRRIPEYTQVHYLQVHPFLSPMLLPFPLASLRGCALRAMDEIHTQLVLLGFIRDGAHVAGSAGIGYGLGIEQRKPRQPVLRKSSSYVSKLDQWKERGYEQYMHRSAPVFLRVLHDALVWIPSYAYETAFELTPDVLFTKVCQWMLKSLERKMRSDSV
ncbi:hypothetical protein SPRG_11629 [Saprolegnia parasitica CBS 223.65]|uniref:DEP domain-containing protein n=1 Tax=Saprolegnia parasitica (strain CBS 223.65) TaxID=695850 RepID=A0A067C2E9_SAPPC|nr:hypothetical protein SPRG_11629 [Saprolegnia parasitica CBS 223.65]KDO23315.1 hypothetical protein SPRG_11629 [Saprolegnia parasitica CBS 223.65]|eukprot:XP_012205967.1 hypothetical protein SPRG_11629 [Saprolegnia parasitica CBS 223.65]